MNIFEQLMAGLRDSIKPRNLAMLIGALALLGFYLQSELPGAAQARRFLPLG